MGCDTKGFVSTKEKDPFKICGIIESAIFEEIKRDSRIDNITAVWGDKYSYPHTRIHPNEMLSVKFRFDGEERDMKVFFTCDSDYSEVKKGKKIIIHLGAWGQSVRLIKVVLAALSQFGQAYIVENDCETDWKKLEEAIP